MRSLTAIEAAALRAAIRSDRTAVLLDLPDLVDFLLGTGLRIGEACAVRWPAVDLTAGVLEVNSTAVRTKQLGLVIQERPKSAAGWRVIALPTSVVTMLQARRRSAQSASDVVFLSPMGQVRDRSNTTADLRRAFDRAGFDWVSSHVPLDRRHPPGRRRPERPADRRPARTRPPVTDPGRLSGSQGGHVAGRGGARAVNHKVVVKWSRCGSTSNETQLWCAARDSNPEPAD
ncbi:MAG: tyrosine-type recombinase/integrase [Geodermatophilaceae bacterium]